MSALADIAIELFEKEKAAEETWSTAALNC
jgi:hypothetical protein